MHRKADSLDSARVAEALRSNAVTTLLQDLRFEQNGDLSEPKIWIYQVVEGEFQQVE